MHPRNAYSSDEEFLAALRDEFAGQALNGFASQCDSTGTWSWLLEDAAIDAYRVADAMLAERAKGGVS